ncbi:hypothetical protein DM755_23800, partial [Salmonella enterica subsp. enterica serovar Java]|nr:hypothetical protein [Salmonella enterica subsp. enterica serovar Enteritidis]EBQ9871867.1 hypothetical protein [Salmonella enterica subsp. enterica serovar Java]EBQ8967021.1 hypothetical protein [Salmonella enterica subsp. enterica serovar Enteritidis]EBQ9347742.1 hypothetical protein [Salmonella enterica subsp. enterica serovar Enteritidis]EBU6438081.1 hypothetical protein [Salmonella enterica subsp. enterica serovar Enteritidis]
HISNHFAYKSPDQSNSLPNISLDLFHWWPPDAKCPCRRRLNSDANKSDHEKLNRCLVSD